MNAVKDRDREDKKQIGLTATANEAITRIASEHFAGVEQDAYRFAIAYAIGRQLDLSLAPTGGFQTKYHAEAVESGTTIRDLLRLFGIGDASRPFATMERLADIGIRDMARRLDGNESFAELLVAEPESSDASREPMNDPD